jgi:hypothetical protein
MFVWRPFLRSINEVAYAQFALACRLWHAVQHRKRRLLGRKHWVGHIFPDGQEAWDPRSAATGTTTEVTCPRAMHQTFARVGRTVFNLQSIQENGAPHEFVRGVSLSGRFSQFYSYGGWLNLPKANSLRPLVVP